MHHPASHLTGRPHFYVTAEGSILGEDTPENHEIVRRIHACVNACDGIATEELESGIISDMRRVISEIAPLLENAHVAQTVDNAAITRSEKQTVEKQRI